MYDDNQSPYRCPICLVRPSLCTTDALTGKHTVGCLTCNCKAPVFTQKENESKYVPLIEWDKWVVKYRKEHPRWHEEYLCAGCIRYEKHKDCEFYDENIFNCSEYRNEGLEDD